MIAKKILSDTLVSICARGGSKGIKDKNIVKIKNKPLIYYAIEKAKNLNFNYICLSTDSNKIANFGKKKKLDVFFKRSKKLSGDRIGKLDVWKDLLLRSKKYYSKNFKYFLDIDVSNPLTKEIDIINIIKIFFLKNKEKVIDGVFCANKSFKNPYFNILVKVGGKYKVILNKKNNISSRQQAPETYDHIAALYFFKSSYIEKATSFLDGSLEVYNIPFERSFDIDDYEDINVVKKLL